MKRRFLICLLTCISLKAVADGVLDPSFGVGGVALSGVDNAGGFVRGLAIQSDGKIVICDRVTTSGNADFYVARFNTDGTLDSTFGVGGRASVDFGGADFCNAVAVQSDGKLVLAGSTSAGSGGFAIARLNADGTPDTSFGTADGQVVLSFGVGTETGANALAIQPSGTVTVVGSAGSNVAIAQLSPDGTTDSSFGVDGEITSHFALSGGAVKGRAVALDSLGRLVIVASGSGSDGRDNFLLTRLLPGGATDMTFGVEGFVTVYFTYGGSNSAIATEVALQSDGQIVVAGTADVSPTTTAQNYQYAIARLNDDGTQDATFATDGQEVISFSLDNNQARGLGIQTNGLIVLAGQASASGGGAVATATRLKADGSVDSNFGEQTYNIGASSAGFYSLIISGTDIYAAGFYPVSGGNDDFVAKLTNDQIFGNGF